MYSAIKNLQKFPDGCDIMLVSAKKDTVSYLSENKFEKKLGAELNIFNERFIRIYGSTFFNLK